MSHAAADVPASPDPDTHPRSSKHGRIPNWSIEGIDTEPMTQNQHRAAVRALAALIANWYVRKHTNAASADRATELVKEACPVGKVE